MVSYHSRLGKLEFIKDLPQINGQNPWDRRPSTDAPRADTPIEGFSGRKSVEHEFRGPSSDGQKTAEIEETLTPRQAQRLAKIDLEINRLTPKFNAVNKDKSGHSRNLSEMSYSDIPASGSGPVSHAEALLKHMQKVIRAAETLEGQKKYRSEEPDLEDTNQSAGVVSASRLDAKALIYKPLYATNAALLRGTQGLGAGFISEMGR